MTTQTTDQIATLYNHSHDANGKPLAEHCCGCWLIRYDDSGLYALCNECGERRDINEEMTLIAPPQP